MDFYGRIKEICPLETGTSERGTWQRQTIVVESFENPNNFLAIDAIGERIQQLGKFTEGNPVKVSFSVTSRKGEKGYFTSATLWEIKPL